MPVVRRSLRQMAKNEYRFSSLILGIVESAPFQMRMKKGEAQPESLAQTQHGHSARRIE
jgi:hypothetical protein